MLTATHAARQALAMPNFFKADADTQTPYTGQIKAKSLAAADLSLVTAEGDTVSLSVQSVLGAAYTTYDAQGRLHGALGVRAETLQVRTDNRLAFDVTGDLNTEERADIEQLLGRLTEIATDFFSGDLDRALALALDNDDLDSIARFEANLTLTQQVSVRQRLAASQTDSNHVASPSGVLTADTTSQAPSGITQILDHLMQAVHTAERADQAWRGDLPGSVLELLHHLADDLHRDAATRKLAAHLASAASQRFHLTVAAGDTETAISSVAW